VTRSGIFLASPRLFPPKPISGQARYRIPFPSPRFYGLEDRPPPSSEDIIFPSPSVVFSLPLWREPSRGGDLSLSFCRQENGIFFPLLFPNVPPPSIKIAGGKNKAFSDVFEKTEIAPPPSSGMTQLPWDSRKIYVVPPPVSPALYGGPSSIF